MIVFMTPSLVFEVHGDPAPQGSKNAGVSKAGKGFVYEQNSKTQTQWRQDVVNAGVAARDVVGHETFDGPVAVVLLLRLRRPLSVKIAKRPFPCVKPDIDKITRNCLDGLKQAGVYRDDAQVINLFVQKRYATDDVAGAPGASVRVELVPLPEII
jgi:Holliday junction resolvase RusA-like endonuclease